MDKFLSTAAPEEAKKAESSPHGRVMNFFHSVKNYMLAKLHSGKYEVNNENSVNLVSYGAKSFDDDGADSQDQGVVQLRQPVVSLPDELRLKEAVMKTLGKMIKDGHQLSLPSTSAVSPPAHADLVEMIDKTFSRQLDIFDELIQVIDLDAKNRQFLPNDPVEEGLDSFIRSFIHSLLNEIQPKNGPQTILPQITPLNELQLDLPPPQGDTPQVRNREICCECQEVDEKGASVPLIAVWPLDPQNNDNSA